MKRNLTDELFSRYIRERDGWSCERCGRYYGDPERRPFLDCMHLVKGRGNRQVRWDPENCAAGCQLCHGWLDTHPAARKAWFLRTFGQAQWDRVWEQSLATDKVDERAIRALLRRLLNQRGIRHV